MTIQAAWAILIAVIGDGWLSVAILIIVWFIHRKTHTLLKRQRYGELKISAMDYALEKSFKNGYADHRDAKMKELVEKENFIITK